MYAAHNEAQVIKGSTHADTDSAANIMNIRSLEMSTSRSLL